MRIKTRGYRGKGTDFQYLPGGTYAVGAQDDWAGGVVRRALADEMLAINLAQVIEADPEPPIAQEPAQGGEVDEAPAEDSTAADDAPVRRGRRKRA